MKKRYFSKYYLISLLLIFIFNNATFSQSTKIALTPSMITSDNVGDGSTALVDEQSIAGDPLNNIASGNFNSSWKPSWDASYYSSNKANCYIDLGKSYNLTN